MCLGDETVIYKQMDDKSGALNTLERLLTAAGGDRKKCAAIEEDIRTLRAGIEGERDAAYHIDFHVQDRKNSGVIHDLRIELSDGRTAQIDHLLINRAYIFYVLETKAFKHGVKITEEGEFLRWNDWKKTFEGMPSPLEQAERHGIVIQKLMASMGMPEPEVRCFTLVSPKARIDRPKRFDTSRVVKADQFFNLYVKDVDSSSMLKAVINLIRIDPLADVAARIVGCHRPIVFNYAAKFGLTETQEPSPAAPSPPTGATAPQQPQCRHCDGQTLTIQHGKFGYYFKCEGCDGNTAIKINCGHAGHKERIRKDGINFYRECSDCGTNELYFTNNSVPADARQTGGGE
jgi:hypothetical protein